MRFKLGEAKLLKTYIKIYLNFPNEGCNNKKTAALRLSSLRSSLEEETLVNAGHVAPRFWERACEGWWVVLVNVCNFSRTVNEKCNTSYIYPNNVRSSLN